MPQVLSRELVQFLESGVSMQVGTRDSCLVPEAVRAVGARAVESGREVVVYVPVATGARTADNLAENGRIAVCFSRMEDHRTIQVKGTVLEVRGAAAEERATVDRYRAAFGENLAFLGMPPRLSFRVASWPCHAVRFRVETVWVQTPGPGAGDALGRGTLG